MPSPWERLEEGLYRFQDSCTIYALQGPAGTVLINAGAGQTADHLDEVARGKPITVLLTHHFRDHTDGAIRLHDKVPMDYKLSEKLYQYLHQLEKGPC